MWQNFTFLFLSYSTSMERGEINCVHVSVCKWWEIWLLPSWVLVWSIRATKYQFSIHALVQLHFLLSFVCRFFYSLDYVCYIIDFWLGIKIVVQIWMSFHGFIVLLLLAYWDKIRENWLNLEPEIKMLPNRRLKKEIMDNLLIIWRLGCILKSILLRMANLGSSYTNSQKAIYMTWAQSKWEERKENICAWACGHLVF